MRVTHIVSLGMHCRVTYQLQRFFDFDFNFPFDWWITKPRGILRALDPDFDPYEPSQLSERIQNGALLYIEATDRSIMFYHDFPRDKNRSDTPVVAEWRQHIEPARSRFLRRRERLYSIDLPSNKLLFVRHGPDAPDEQKALIAGLNQRFTAAKVDLLFINPVEASSDPTAMTIQFDESEGPTWRGTRAEWDAALGSLGIEIDNPDRPRFRDSAAIAEANRSMVSRLAAVPAMALRKARRMVQRISTTKD